MAEIEEITKDVSKVFKSKDTRKYIFFGLIVVVILFLVLRSRNKTTSSGGYDIPAGSVTGSGAALSQLAGEMNEALNQTKEQIQGIEDYTNEKLEYQYTGFETGLTALYQFINQSLSDIDKKFQNIDIPQTTEYVYVIPQQQPPPSTVTQEKQPEYTPITNYDYDLIGRLKADISRVEAKRSDPDTIAYFNKQYGGIDGYLSSQYNRLATAEKGY